MRFITLPRFTFAFVAALLAWAIFANTAQAEYLHLANATSACRARNNSAADSIMRLSVGQGVMWYPGGTMYDPYGQYRRGNNSLWIMNSYWSSNSGIYAVLYHCEVRGTDSNIYFTEIGQDSPVFYQG